MAVAASTSTQVRGKYLAELAVGDTEDRAYKNVATKLEALAIGDARPFALHGRRIAAAGDDGVRVLEAGKGELFKVLAGDRGQVLHATSLFSGQAMVCLQRGDGSDVFWVWRANGALIHRIHVPSAARWAVSESRGLGVIRTADNELVVVDLRYGRAVEHMALIVEA